MEFQRWLWAPLSPKLAPTSLDYLYQLKLTRASLLIEVHSDWQRIHFQYTRALEALFVKSSSFGFRALFVYFLRYSVSWSYIEGLELQILASLRLYYLCLNEDTRRRNYCAWRLARYLGMKLE